MAIEDHEAEMRRLRAEEKLSKSNGPIRRWLGKMGLISERPSEEQVPTAELRRPEPEFNPEPEPELLTERELEVTTADTRPLPPDVVEEPSKIEPKTDDDEMESKATPDGSGFSELSERGSGPLLDLGEFEPARAAADEDFVLDIDFDDNSEPLRTDFRRSASQAEESYSNVSTSPTVQEHSAVNEFAAAESEPARGAEALGLTVDPMAETQEMARPIIDEGSSAGSDRAFAEPEIFEGEAVRMVSAAPGGGSITLEQLSPEAIDAIARRAVEMLSEKVVQEIAWEVVPQLAELLIKRQLEEKNS
ncbi:MAG TPA: hypothetical protein VJU86_12125 [Pyrinomonadaceae bacterium]|nr:hypothetical protein [Pyrinomonadaceae bacterium]